MEQHPITPGILHKDCVEDVLIRQFELTLPARLDLAQHDELTQNLNATEMALIDKAYRRDDKGLILRRIAQKDAPATPEISADAPVKASALDRLLAPRTAYDGATTGLSDAEKAQISDILANRLQQGICPINSYLALNDTCNYFFYRKSHEHVPGLMLIEMARQAMYHYFYNHSGYNRGDVSISISRLDVDFAGYVESAYDLEVVIAQTEGIARAQPRFVDKTATFFQNGQIVARVRLQGGAMKMKLFKRLRTLKLPETHWFNLSSRVLPRAVVTSQQGRIHDVTLAQLSMTGARILEPVCDEDGLHSIAFHVAGHGFLTLPLAGPFLGHSGVHHELRFDELTADQRYHLQETIKCHCFFAQDSAEAAVPELSDLAELGPVQTGAAPKRGVESVAHG